MKKPSKKKKLAKPYRDFPLFLHQSGQWAKKIRGRMYYFGVDPDEALKKYTKERDDLQAGLTPRDRSGELTVRDLANRFLDSKKALLATGELSPRTWGHYYTTCERIVGSFGKTRSVVDLTSEDFEKLRMAYAKTRGAHAISGEVQRVRTIFKYAWDEGLIEKPVRFGTTFKKPSKKIMRKARHDAGPRMIEAEDLRNLIDGAMMPGGEQGPELVKPGASMRAMILLAINCGFGQTDVANLPRKALDLAGGWVDYPRPKTQIMRRCPLWPETVAAIREALAKMPKAKSNADAGLVFITKYGARWVRVREYKDKPAVPIDSVRLEFNKLLVALKLKRRGLGFYALRHVFRTVADGAKDQPAIDHIMGHANDDMASLYRERIDDERLQAVTEHVRKWLFG
jgi:integrase